MRKIILLLLILILLAGCGQEYPIIEDRESVIVPDKIKKTPETDRLPPILHSDEYEEPVPMPYPINTAGHEDSGFIMPDGNTFYVWFAPGATSLAEQLDDGVTAIYEHKKVDGEWQQSERVMLRKLTEQSLDGCEFVQDNMMWFCTARTGYTGLHWFTAEYKDNKWQNVKIADFDPSYEVGELHFTADGKELYFHSPREGGLGGYDIWVSENVDGEWQEPEHIPIINSEDTDGWPSLTQDAQELFFTRTYLGSPAIFKSQRIDGEWQEPELIVSQFAGESSVDNEGNLYFTHHFYEDGVQVDADIYVLYKK